MENIQIVMLVKVILCTFGLILHPLGLYALRTCKQRNGQVAILMNLSIAEILLFINDLVEASQNLVEYKDKYSRIMTVKSYRPYKAHHETYVAIYFFITYTCLLEVIFAVFLLTADRLVAVLSPLKYHIVTEEKSIFQRTIMVCWLISISVGSLSLSMYTEYTAYIFILTSVCVSTLFFLISYIIIGVKITRSRTSLQNDTTRSSQRNDQLRIRKHHLVPGLIISTFIVFYVKTVIYRITHVNKERIDKKSYLWTELLRMSPNVGYITDALIYIFLTERNRKIVMKLLQCKRETPNMSSNVYIENTMA